MSYIFTKLHFLCNLTFYQNVAHTHTHKHIHTHTHTYIYIYMDIYMYIYIYIYVCVCVYKYVYKCVYHHHHVVPPARIFLTLSRQFSQSFIAFGRSSGQHPVSSHSCCMYVRTWPYAGVHRSTSLMSSSLLFSSVPRVWFV